MEHVEEIVQQSQWKLAYETWNIVDLLEPLPFDKIEHYLVYIKELELNLGECVKDFLKKGRWVDKMDSNESKTNLWTFFLHIPH